MDFLPDFFLEMRRHQLSESAWFFSNQLRNSGDDLKVSVFKPMSRRFLQATSCFYALGSSFSHCSGYRVVGATTYLQSVPARILEEYYIVTSLVLHLPFNIASTGLPSDFCQPVNLARALRPKGNPVLIGKMTGRFGHTEELGDVGVRCLELQPPFDTNVASEA